MKVNLYCASVGYVAYEYMLSKLNDRDKTKTHIILTPDRFNFNIENELFDILGEDSFFDINVMTLTRLARKILGDKHLSQRVLTMQGASAIIQKLLIENSGDLVTYGQSYKFKGFSKQLFQTISSFKSCNIAPNDIDENINNVALANKLHDIKLIYSKYEEYLQNDYTDSFNQLNLLARYIDGGLDNTNFYFVGFDDFTPEQYSVIAALIKNANSVNFATTRGNSNNKKIYLNNIYLNVIDLCKMLGINVNVEQVQGNLSKEKDFMSKYAFAYGGDGKLGNYMSVYKFNNINDEISHTLQSIRMQVARDRGNYNDYAIFVPSFDLYKKDLHFAFEKYNIPHFFDDTKYLCDLSCFKYISQLLNLPLNFSREAIIEVMKNKYSGLDYDLVCQFERQIVKSGLYGDALFEIGTDEIKQFLQVLKLYSTKSKQSIKLHIARMIETLDKLKFSENFDSVCNLYKQNDIVEYKTLMQMQNKLSKIINELTGILGDYECEYDAFVEIIESYFDNTSVALPPITNCVFVGDQIASYVSHKKYVYILGVNEGDVPSYGLDLGMISDDEIELMTKKISPTVAYVNKKRKYRVFENLFSADNHLTISYVCNTPSGEKVFPASFVEPLAKMGRVGIIDGSVECDFVQANVDKVNKDITLFNNPNKTVALDNFVDALKFVKSAESDSLNQVLATMNKVLDGDKYIHNYNYQNVKENIDISGVYFAHNTSSITQMQTFYECPYKFFARYGLKLKEVETDEIKPLDFGVIIHRFLELAVKKIENAQDIKKLALDVINKILTEEYANISNNPKNKHLLKALKNECVRLAIALHKQVGQGEFKPKYYELPFDEDAGIKVKVNGKTITFNGVIDRVDVFDNYFRIIDYKTGGSSFKDYGDIASGTKIQLIVYLKAYMDSHNEIPGGVFYLPISTSFADKDEDSIYKLRGVVLEDLNCIRANDRALKTPNYTSNVIGFKTDAKGELTKAGENLRLTREQIDKLTDYVYKKLEKAIENILCGNITPIPYKNSNKTACDYCPYSAMCNFNVNYGNNYALRQNVKKVEELENE